MLTMKLTMMSTVILFNIKSDCLQWNYCFSPVLTYAPVDAYVEANKNAPFIR